MTNIGTASQISEVLNAKNNDFTKDGKCSGCGGCCTDCIHMSETEINRIKAYIKKHEIKPCRHIPPMQKPGTAIDFLCPFVDMNAEYKKCRIYKVRPTVCEAFICNKTPMEFLSKLPKEKQRCLAKIFDNEISKLPVNMGQTFYPEIYTPKVGDQVIFNKRYRAMMELYETTIFTVLTAPDRDNHVMIQTDDGKTLRCDVTGLTKLI